MGSRSLLNMRGGSLTRFDPDQSGKRLTDIVKSALKSGMRGEWKGLKSSKRIGPLKGLKQGLKAKGETKS